VEAQEKETYPEFFHRNCV